MKALLLDGGNSSTDYSVTVSRSFYGFDLTLSFIDTDLDKKKCYVSYWCDSSAALQSVKACKQISSIFATVDKLF